MKIVLLGVGSAFAKTLFNTNFLIYPDEGSPFLIDCGQTATHSLHKLGIKPYEVSRILISHLHNDHIGGLEEMGFCGYFGWEEKAELFAHADVLKWLWPSSLKGAMGQQLVGPDGVAFDAELATYFKVNVLGEKEKPTFGSVEVTPFKTPHISNRPSWGYSLLEKRTGESVMLTCDSKLHLGNLKLYGSGAKVIYHDCQFRGAPEFSIHTTLGELMELPEELQEKIRLVHYDDDWCEFEGKTGKMTLARDHETLTL